MLWRAERTVWAERICKSADSGHLQTSASERSRSPAVRAPFRGWADDFKRMCAVLCLQRAREERRRRRQRWRSVFRQNDRRCFRIQNMCCCLWFGFFFFSLKYLELCSYSGFLSRKQASCITTLFLLLLWSWTCPLLLLFLVDNFAAHLVNDCRFNVSLFPGSRKSSDPLFSACSCALLLLVLFLQLHLLC